MRANYTGEFDLWKLIAAVVTLALYCVCSCLSALVCWWVVNQIKDIVGRYKTLLVEEREEYVA